MTLDPLSEILDILEIRGVLSGGFAADGSWVTHGKVHVPLKLIAVANGHALLTTNGIDAPISLGPGGVAILNDRSWLKLEGGDGSEARQEILPEEGFSSARLVAADRESDDIVIGGRIELGPAGRTLLLNVLPPVAHVQASTRYATSLHGSLQRLTDEATGHTIGAAFAIRQYGQLLLLEVLRAYAQLSDVPPGMLGVLKDERLRPALERIHQSPGTPWSLHDLAQAASMSRTTFAQHFRKAAGVPPLTYLSQWRMLLAQRALRDGGTQISTLARELGFASESSFSSAFKRTVGESPLRYRQRRTRRS